MHTVLQWYYRGTVLLSTDGTTYVDMYLVPKVLRNYYMWYCTHVHVVQYIRVHTYIYKLTT